MNSLLQVDTSSLSAPAVSVLAVAALALAFVVWRRDSHDDGTSSSDLPLPKGTTGWPIVRDLLDRNQRKMTRDRVYKYGHVSKNTFIGQDCADVVGSANLKQILLGDDKIVEPFTSNAFKKLLGSKSLFFERGRRHMLLRSALLKAFTTRAMRGCLPVVESATRRMLDLWSPGERAVRADLQACTLQVFCTHALGMSDEKWWTSSETNDLFQQFARGMGTLPLDLPGLPYRAALKARAKLLERIRPAVEARMAAAQRGDPLPDDVITYMIEFEQNGERLTVEDIVDQGLFVVFAGHETTSRGMSIVLAFLGKYPDEVLKLRAEQQKIRPDPDAPWTLEQVREMEYLDAFVWEVFRCYSPVPASFRVAKKNFEIDGVQVPKGWAVRFHTELTSKLSESWRDPDTFSPSRFLRQSGEHAKAAEDEWCFKPFGGGKRQCPGQRLALLETKVLVGELIRRFSVRVPEFRAIPWSQSAERPSSGVPDFWSNSTRILIEKL